MPGSRFKNFSESKNNKYIFISENKILYDKSEKSYKFDANYLILVSTVSKLSIADLRRSEYVFASLNTKVLGIILNNIHQSCDFQSFNLETENTILDRVEYDKKFIDSTYPFDDLRLDSLFVNTIRTIKEYE